jgi:hypothetical protein
MAPLTGVLVEGKDGLKGFDCNTRLSPGVAARFKQHGYQFAIRYVRRAQRHNYDLTSDEAQLILDIGMGVMAVQHCESVESWIPSAVKGVAYGATAGKEMREIGFPIGSMVWCDLEGVAKGTEPKSVIEYCNTWFDAVKAAGFLPGLYCGWRCGLNAHDLYWRLKFRKYWGAGNLNLDEYPAVRGVCMKQHWAKASDIPPGVLFEIDTDTVQADALGGRPVILMPESP